MIEMTEQGICSKDPQISAAAVQLYHDRALELIDAFKRTGIKRPFSPADAFMMGPAGRASAELSRSERCCYRCDSLQGLQMEAFGRDMLEIRLVCSSCQEQTKKPKR